MIARRRFLLRLASVFGAAVAMGSAQVVPATAPAPTAVPPAALAALLGALSPWNSTVGLRTGLGYKDNLLLSHAHEQGSGFVRSGLEGFLWHLPSGRVDYFAMLNAEGTRYFSGAGIDHEAEAYMHAEWRYQLDERFKFSLALQGYYLDEIFDVSDTDVQRVVAQLKVAGATVGPQVRWAFQPWAWIEAQAVGKREAYQDGLNNNHVGDGTMRLGWRPAGRFETSIAGMERSRNFDLRQQYSVGGRALLNTRLQIREREAEWRTDITWDDAARWKSTTRFSTLAYRDNGSGYFDYHARKAAQSVVWTNDSWLVQVEGAAKRLEFGVQTVGLGINPPARVKEEYSAQCRIERKIGERWTIYAEFNWERNRCNDPIASYNMNEGLLGVRWSWEK